MALPQSEQCFSLSLSLVTMCLKSYLRRLIAEERRQAMDKGERERYTQLKADFQRTPRRDNKPFLNEQCKEI